MNRSLIFSVFSFSAIFAPDTLFGSDRLDAPGPGYRHQVERFAPQKMKAKPFQLEVAQPFGPTAAQGIVVPSKASAFSPGIQPSFTPAVFDSSNFSQPIRLFESPRASGGALPDATPPKQSP
jgi:hypothetical protein